MSLHEVEISEKQVLPVTEMDSCFVIFEQKCLHFWLKLFETLNSNIPRLNCVHIVGKRFKILKSIIQMMCLPTLFWKMYFH